MTADETGLAFSLEYSLEPDDLKDFYANDLKLRRRRGWMACVLVASTAAAVTLMVLFVRSFVGAPISNKPQPLLLAGAAGMASAASMFVRPSWRLAPSRLARLSWKKTPDLHGRHRDDIGPEGVTWTSPDGTKTSIPWSVVVSVRETSRAFVLLDGDGRARGALPKRGLHDPALLPALGTYIRDRAGTLPPVTDAGGQGRWPSGAGPVR